MKIMQNRKIKVLYIAGYSFSGSTILTNILGQIDGFFSVGELRCIWEKSLIKNYRCGCGRRFHECPTWKGVLDESFGSMHQVNAREMIRSSETRAHLPLMLLPFEKKMLMSRLGEYPANLEKLYQAIQSTTDSKVIVDSSKSPLYGYILDLLPSIDLYVVHLIRDPRAVQYSGLKRKMLKKTEWKDYSAVGGCLTWNACNLTVETFWRSSSHKYLTLYYEDFIQRPKETLERILKLVQEKTTLLPFVEEHKVELSTNHTVIGNNNRFKSGTIELQLDNKWKEEMKPSDKAIVTMLSWPLLLRYGYLSRN